MLTPLAFLDVGGGILAVAEGKLEPAAAPPPGAAAFFAPDFRFSPGHPCWFTAPGNNVRRLSRAEWLSRFPAAQALGAAPIEWRPPEQSSFRQAFVSLRAGIDAGQLRKGVPVARMSAAVPPDEAERLFRVLLARVPHLPPDVVPYGFYLPEGSTARGPEFMIGATPELLFELEGGHSLSTMAVASTRGIEQAGTLEGSEKERDEHAAVVDDLIEQLSRWGRARTSRTEWRRFGDLVHLVAHLHVESAATLDFETVARCLHPTPALGVYPRNAAGAEWLSALDPQNERRRFGAPFGLRWGDGGGRAVVAIRNLQYAEGKLEIWAGCGVVAMSEYEDEWREVLQKMQSVRALWGV